MPVTSSIRAMLLSLAAFAGTAIPASADIYEIDKDHTEVRFTWDHVGMSRQGGRFRDVSGTLNFDPVAPGNSSVDVRIKVASISTGVAKLDEHLIRSGEFFDAQAFPTITFRSTSVAPSTGRTAEVTGNLSMNGVTKPVTMSVKWNFSGDHPLGTINPVYKEIYVSGFSATAQILRSDWGLSRTVPFISDELRITIETEMHRKQITSPQLAPEAAGSGAGPSSAVPQQLPGATTGPALQVPEPGSPAPLPPVEGGPPHATTMPPPAGAPPTAEPPLDDSLTPAPLPDDSAPESEPPAPRGEPLNPVDGLDN
ncbi:MAG: YceI family protein [Hyphomicrobiaceae bacterium]|nr:YceI family protein [Hyphomicrobiaceae bacterium]